MSRRRNPLPERTQSESDELLAAMDAAELRAVVRDLLLELDHRAHVRVVTSPIEHAVRAKAGWAPGGPGRDDVAEVIAFARAAQRDGYADPRDVDARLSRGSAAFFRRDYTREIFFALLRPLEEDEIDPGQHELVDEVLGVDMSACTLELFTADRDETRLAAPEAGGIVRQAGVQSPSDGKARVGVLRAMRDAAEHRLAEVTEQKRRRHYGHAAELVAACLACDKSPDADCWATTVRQAYRRFPALRAEFEVRLGSS